MNENDDFQDTFSHENEEEIPTLTPLLSTKLSLESETKAKKIPVTILSGFLGSGKTTFLNAILSTNVQNIKFAIIENEFGEEIGVEKLIVKKSSSEEDEDPSSKGSKIFDLNMYELGNGCICCSVKDNLVNTLEFLIEKKRDEIDYILIETTGMANLGKLIEIFWLDEEIESKIYLDGIITLVDASHCMKYLFHPDTQKEALSQIAFADVLLLNKQDLLPVVSAFSSSDVSMDLRLQIEATLKKMNGLATFLWTSKKEMKSNFQNYEQILYLNAFSVQKSMEKTLNYLELQRQEETSSMHAYHSGKVDTFCITFEKPFGKVAKMEHLIANLLWETTDSDTKETTDRDTITSKRCCYFRIKGVLWFKEEQEDQEYKYILQAVNQVFEIEKSDEKWESTLPKPKIVFIGVNMDRTWIEKEFNKLTFI